MWNEPTRKRLAKIPMLYATEDMPLQEKLIYLHFFIGGCDWYVAEFDGKDIFFGYVVGDFPELGTFSLSELQSCRGKLGCPIERDRYFEPCRLSAIQKGEVH